MGLEIVHDKLTSHHHACVFRLFIELGFSGCALVIPKGRALWGSPKEIDFFLWGVLPKGDFESSFPKSTLLWGPNPLGSSLNARKGVQGNGGQ